MNQDGNHAPSPNSAKTRKRKGKASSSEQSDPTSKAKRQSLESCSNSNYFLRDEDALDEENEISTEHTGIKRGMLHIESMQNMSDSCDGLSTEWLKYAKSGESSTAMRTRGESVGNDQSILQRRTCITSGSASPCSGPRKVSPPKPVRVVATLSVSQRTEHQTKTFNDLDDNLIVSVFSYLVTSGDILKGPVYVCHRWNKLCDTHCLWSDQPVILDRRVNRLCFKYLGEKNKGTEGLCYKMLHRASGCIYAMKKARVYPEGEGVPYYMLRELAFLQGLSHEHISSLVLIKLVKNELFVFFRYVEKTLFDLINPTNDPNGGKALAPKLTKLLLFQVIKGVSFCHRRGVLHRNLKPKHLLVDVPYLRDIATVTGERKLVSVVDENSKPVGFVCEPVHQPDVKPEPNQGEEAEGEAIEPSREKEHTPASIPLTKLNKVECKLFEKSAVIRIADFALVRSTSIPLRKYTTEVVTLWYRAPEVLMGGDYFAAVDMWSVGCVFGEMVLGRPLFPGICEVDQIFQIFSLLGTPTERTWPNFTKLKHYNFAFPNWKPLNLQTHFPGLEPAGIDLLCRMLNVDPAHRITATEALGHRYFDEIRDAFEEPSDEYVIPEVTSSGVDGDGLTALSKLSNAADATATSAPSRSSSGTSCAASVPSSHCTAQSVLTGSQVVQGSASTERKGGQETKHSGDAGAKIEKNPSALAGELSGSPKSLLCQNDSPLPHWYYKPVSSRNPFLDYARRRRRGLGDIAYLSHFYRYLKQLEVLLFPMESYMEYRNQDDQVKVRGSDLAPHHRSMLVDWLVEVIDVFDMSLRSVFLAVNFIDRFLSKVPVSRKSFQLLGATCLHIASKCEDVSYIGVDDLVVCADNVYVKEDVLQLEEQVLNTLDFHLAVPTSIDFLNVFVERLGYSEEEERQLQGPGAPPPQVRQKIQPTVAKLAQYITELSLQDHNLIPTHPSRVAAGALLYAFHCQGAPIAPTHLQQVTGYAVKDLEEIVGHLHRGHAEAPQQESLLVIRKRYNSEVNLRVAEIKPLPLCSELFAGTEDGN